VTEGFDVIIGNPPYLEMREIDYVPQGFKTYESGAVHAMIMERSVNLLNKHGCISMIVPLALVSTQRMKILQKIIEDGKSCCMQISHGDPESYLILLIVRSLFL